MHLYGIDSSGHFSEYQRQVFANDHREKVMESWLEANPGCIIESSLLLIGRQVTTNLGGFIDLLAIDREGAVVVMELKRGKTPRDTLAQALEYASFVADLGYEQLEGLWHKYVSDDTTPLAEGHRTYFGLAADEAVSFNKDQRIVIVAGEIDPAVEQMSVYLCRRGLRVTCLEFSYFQSPSGEQLLSVDTVVSAEAVKAAALSTETLPVTTREAFLAGCDEAGRAVFVPLLDLAKEQGLAVNWGSRGFSVRIPVGGTIVTLALCFPRKTKPQEADQSLRIAFGELASKVPTIQACIQESTARLTETGLFAKSGAMGDLRYWLNEAPSVEQVHTVMGVVRDLIHAMRQVDEEASGATISRGRDGA